MVGIQLMNGVAVASVAANLSKKTDKLHSKTVF
jgi:hypothetical protein